MPLHPIRDANCVVLAVRIQPSVPGRGGKLHSCVKIGSGLLSLAQKEVQVRSLAKKKSLARPFFNAFIQRRESPIEFALFNERVTKCALLFVSFIHDARSEPRRCMRQYL